MPFIVEGLGDAAKKLPDCTAPHHHQHEQTDEAEQQNGHFQQRRQHIEEAALVLIERDLEMCRWLERRFPHAEVVEGEAADIGAILDERAIVAPSVVVSSLPLRNMAEEERDAIVRASFEVLPRDGIVVQFTYARRPSIACERLGVACRRAGFTALNVPPAGVWRIARP